MKGIFRFLFIVLAAWSIYHALSLVYGSRPAKITVQMCQAKIDTLQFSLDNASLPQHIECKHELMLARIKLEGLQESYSEHAARLLWRQLENLDLMMAINADATRGTSRVCDDQPLGQL